MCHFSNSCDVLVAHVICNEIVGLFVSAFIPTLEVWLAHHVGDAMHTIFFTV